MGKAFVLAAALAALAATARGAAEKELSLRQCRGDRPLVLVFGSFT